MHSEERVGQAEPGGNRDRTVVKSTRLTEWEPIPAHIGLYHREIVDAAEADRMGIRMSSVLWERIDVGGGVLPHYHNVAEIIHITVGKVRLLIDGQWRPCEAGDTFHVPAGVVHSVMNDCDAPTEQISIFVPAESSPPPNAWFETTKVDVPLPALMGRRGAEVSP